MLYVKEKETITWLLKTQKNVTLSSQKQSSHTKLLIRQKYVTLFDNFTIEIMMTRLLKKMYNTVIMMTRLLKKCIIQLYLKYSYQISKQTFLCWYKITMRDSNDQVTKKNNQEKLPRTIIFTCQRITKPSAGKYSTLVTPIKLSNGKSNVKEINTGAESYEGHNLQAHNILTYKNIYFGDN